MAKKNVRARCYSIRHFDSTNFGNSVCSGFASVEHSGTCSIQCNMVAKKYISEEYSKQYTTLLAERYTNPGVFRSLETMRIAYGKVIYDGMLMDNLERDLQLQKQLEVLMKQSNDKLKAKASNESYKQQRAVLEALHTDSNAMRMGLIGAVRGDGAGGSGAGGSGAGAGNEDGSQEELNQRLRQMRTGGAIPPITTWIEGAGQ